MFRMLISTCGPWPMAGCCIAPIETPGWVACTELLLILVILLIGCWMLLMRAFVCCCVIICLCCCCWGWWWTCNSTLLICPTNEDEIGAEVVRDPFRDEIGIGCWGNGTSRGRLFVRTPLTILDTVVDVNDEGGDCCGVFDVADGWPPMATTEFEEDDIIHTRFRHAFLSLPGPP